MEKALRTSKPAARGSLFISRKDISGIAAGSLCFFIGRVVMMDFINPLAIPYLSVFTGRGKVFYISAFFMMLGMFTKLNGMFLAKYILCISILCAFNFFAEKKLRRPNLFIQASLGAAAILISSIVFVMMNHGSVFYSFIAALELTLTFSLAFILKKGTGVLLSQRRRNALTNEEIISIGLIAGAIITGTADVYIGQVSLRYMLTIWALLIICYKGGSTFAATASVALGFVLYLAGYWDASFPITLAVCSVCAGLFRNTGKLGVLGSFLGIGTIMTFYLHREIFGFELLYSAVFAGIFYVFTPDKFYFNISAEINPSFDNADDYIEKIRELVTMRLNAFSDSFEKLSKAFSSLAKTRTSFGKDDAEKFIDDLAAKNCMTCSRKNHCWEADFLFTYNIAFGVLSTCEKNGVVKDTDIPLEFASKCVNLRGLLSSANNLFELYKTNITWLNRMSESRELVSQQLSGVSGIIKSLSEELDFSFNFNEALEERILNELNKNRIEVNSVIVLENKFGKYEVTINQRHCGGAKSCVKGIIPIVSSILKRRMIKEEPECYESRGKCNLRLIEERKFRVNCGVSRMTKGRGEESGDCYSFMEMKKGECLIALSDGMGSGKRAREESSAAIGLLEDFLESGFDKKVAVKIINSILVLKSSADSFSTLDICSVDLYSGEAEFIKIGAAATFLLRDGRVQIIKSSSLPMGMLNDVEVEMSKKKLQSNDIVVMVTDGITDVRGVFGEKESWLVSILENCEYSHPQDIADYILTEAERFSGEEIRDDMTVLVAKIWGE